MITRPKAQLDGSILKALRILIASAAALTLTWAAAQADWKVDALIPGLISVRAPTTHIAFALSSDSYPPSAFPARYRASEPEGGLLELEIFSNTEGMWSLTLEIPTLEAIGGDAWLEAKQVNYRVNGGLWTRATGAPQVILSQPGPTQGWQLVTIEFELELNGTETAGAYAMNAVLTADADEPY